MTALFDGPTSVHFFTGGLGDMRGFTDSGYLSLYAANHHPASVETARTNWPGLFVNSADVQTIDMRCVPTADVLVASPICTEASPAGGKAAPRKAVQLDENGRPTPGPDWPQTRITMWEPVRYAEVHRPMAYVGENVAQFGTSPLFKAWLHVWDALGYTPAVASVNAAHLKADGIPPLPQSRDRVVWCFLRNDIAEAHGLPDLRPTCDAMCPTCGPVEGVQYWKKNPDLQVGEYGRKNRQYYYVCPNTRCGAAVEPITRGIGEVIDTSVRGARFGDGYFNHFYRTVMPYEQATRDRVAIGLERYCGKPFIVTLRNHCSASSLDEPIGTLTAKGGGHHYLVRPTDELSIDECEYRPLNIREKARAQGFPDHHIFSGDEEDQRLQVGNAVPVNVAAWLARRVKAVLPH
ncbi:DNA cytosine methyltransferase [Streptomyces sp. NBC_01433]|uniref:DNA cytosine methyltransferase n=1 Tax=Streptomyces sp. NBC_01433 TaxID=2903864 RepID=UPI0022520E20|nr:DNA cytosine methyltransferase [Streptomyces sp. NBC_01433]MCX4681654.1 DNA cytosine methyltransferase [Streptomyces sp. NBC_01433]